MIDAGADELAAVRHQHDLVVVFDGEGSHQLAVAVVDDHRGDAFAATAGEPVLVGRRSLAVALIRHSEYELFLAGKLCEAIRREFCRALDHFGVRFRLWSRAFHIIGFAALGTA